MTTLTAGTQIGPYEILAPLGAGGMGEVYRARDGRLGREVAIKVLSKSLAGSPEALARFERESRAVAALSHPNVIVIFDCGSHNGLSYAVSELLEGETLGDRIYRAPIEWREAVRIGVAVAEGLAAAHAKGIVHRDIKPGNIFLTSPGVVKLLDFGLARVENDPLAPTGQTPTGTLPIGTPSPETMPGALIGTIHYMSPEQVRGHPADARSDIFSLGCVLYEIIAGRRPFQRATAAETMVSILYDEPERIENCVRDVPVELCELVRHSMEKEPQNRFQSARDLALGLRALQSAGSSSPSAVTLGAATSEANRERERASGRTNGSGGTTQTDAGAGAGARSEPGQEPRPGSGAEFEKLREFATKTAPDAFRSWNEKITGDDPPEALKGYSATTRKRIFWGGVALALLVVIRLASSGAVGSAGTVGGAVTIAFVVYMLAGAGRKKGSARDRVRQARRRFHERTGDAGYDHAQQRPEATSSTPPPSSAGTRDESRSYRSGPWNDDVADDEISDHSWLITAVLGLCFGMFGAHRFYVGKIGSGIAQLCTIGGLGIWWLCDLIIIAFGGFTDVDGRHVRRFM